MAEPLRQVLESLTDVLLNDLKPTFKDLCRLSISWDSKRVREIEQFIATSTIAKPEPLIRFENFNWRYKGKLLKEVHNEINGERYPCDQVFQIDIDILHYNFDNRRIAIYRKEREAEKKNDPSRFHSIEVSESNAEDISWMEDILLDRNNVIMGVRSTTEGFEKELMTNGQLEPAVITIDGTLRNGNRRKAIFTEILRRTKAKDKGYANLDSEQFKYLKVIILPRDIRGPELFDLENFLQTKKDWKQPYDAITIMNIIKEARDDFELEFEDIRDKYLHDKTKAEIETDYWKIKEIDKYLMAIGKPGQYRMIDRQQEMFEDFVRFNFADAGLSAIPRERRAQKQLASRQREEVFFDMVSANQCNSEVLRPSEKWVRKMAQEIFKKGSDKPEAIISKFYSGVDRTKLGQCEPTNVEKFATNIVSQIDSHTALNIEKQPLDKLKRIARELNSFGPKARASLARKRETSRYVGLAKEGLDKIEKEVAKHQ